MFTIAVIMVTVIICNIFFVMVAASKQSVAHNLLVIANVLAVLRTDAGRQAPHSAPNDLAMKGLGAAASSNKSLTMRGNDSTHEQSLAYDDDDMGHNNVCDGSRIRFAQRLRNIEAWR